MAVPANTVQTYAEVNIREDLSDLIFNVDPYQTPILNRSVKEKAERGYHEWDVDVIPSQNTSNLQIEGDDATADMENPTVRLGNYTAISRKVIQLSGTLQAVRAAGGTNKMGYQLLRNIKGLKTDVEGIMTANVPKTVGTSSTAQVCGGIPAYMSRNVVLGATGAVATGGNVSTIGGKTFALGTAAITPGTKTNLTEAQVDSMNQLVYTGCGKSIETLVVSAKNKQAVSTFAGPTPGSGTVTRFLRTDDDDNTLKVAIDYYDHDFGKFEVIPDLFLADSQFCFGIRWDWLATAFLRQFETEPLAKTGDSDRKMVIVEYTPCVRNEHGLGLICATNG